MALAILLFFFFLFPFAKVYNVASVKHTRRGVYERFLYSRTDLCHGLIPRTGFDPVTATESIR